MGPSVGGMSDTRPWEPPIAGTESEALLGALNRLRWTFRYKTDGLDAAGLASTIPSSTLTLAGLLKHLAAVEDWYSTARLDGSPWGEPWAGFGWDGGDDWDFTSAVEDDPQFLYDLYDGAVRRSRERFAAYLADGDCARAVESAVGETHANARRLLCDLIEEYGRHTGHADLLREAADGRVGEDPPDGWQPVGSGGRG